MRLSIPTKIFIAFSGVILVFMLVFMIGIWRTQRLNAQSQSLNQNIVPLTLLLSDAQNDIKSLDVALGEPDLSTLSQSMQRTRIVTIAPQRASTKLHRALSLSQRDSLGLLGAGEQARMDQLHARLDELVRVADGLDQKTRQLQESLIRQSAPQSPLQQVQALRDAMRRDTAALEAGISTLRNDLSILSDVALLRVREYERENLYAFGVMSAAALLVAIAMLGIALYTVRPLRTLTDGVKRIAHGDYTPLPEYTQPLLGQDELATLTDEFNSMARALVARDEALRDQHAALLRSERLATVGRMTSLITHELRNPLSSIGLNAEMIQDSLQHPIDDDEREELLAQLDTITAEVDRLRDITEEYLVYARHPDPKPAREDLVTIIEQLIDFHLWEWSQAQVSVHFAPARSPALANVDGNQLRQALLNLIKNAVEASPAMGQITVTLDVAPDAPRTWRVSVEDQGGGIDAELAERIFDPFFTAKEGGTGLGLPMTLQIIEQHHGTLTFENLSPHGARFTLTLPFHPSLPATI